MLEHKTGIWQERVTLQCQSFRCEWPKRVGIVGYGIGKHGYSPPPELMSFLENCGVWEIRLNWIMTVRLLAAMYQLFMCVNWSVEVVLCHFGNCCCNFLTFLAIVFLRPVSTPGKARRATRKALRVVTSPGLQVG